MWEQADAEAADVDRSCAHGRLVRHFLGREKVPPHEEADHVGDGVAEPNCSKYVSVDASRHSVPHAFARLNSRVVTQNRIALSAPRNAGDFVAIRGKSRVDNLRSDSVL